MKFKFWNLLNMIKIFLWKGEVLGTVLGCEDDLDDNLKNDRIFCEKNEVAISLK